MLSVQLLETVYDACQNEEVAMLLHSMADWQVIHNFMLLSSDVSCM
jgi:hypothetical protein